MFSLIPNTQQALENMFIFSYTRPYFYSFKHISVQKKVILYTILYNKHYFIDKQIKFLIISFVSLETNVRAKRSLVKHFLNL